MNYPVKIKDCSHKTAIKRGCVPTSVNIMCKSGSLKGRVLDYGCGHGICCNMLGYDGYDPHYRQCNLYGLYDSIICHNVLDVICDVNDRMSVLLDMVRYLAPGGNCFITVGRTSVYRNYWLKDGTYRAIVKLMFPTHICTGQHETYCLSHQSISDIMDNGNMYDHMGGQLVFQTGK